MPAIRLVADRYRADCACGVDEQKMSDFMREADCEQGRRKHIASDQWDSSAAKLYEIKRNKMKRSDIKRD